MSVYLVTSAHALNTLVPFQVNMHVRLPFRCGNTWLAQPDLSLQHPAPLAWTGKSSFQLCTKVKVTGTHFCSVSVLQNFAFIPQSWLERRRVLILFKFAWILQCVDENSTCRSDEMYSWFFLLFSQRASACTLHCLPIRQTLSLFQPGGVPLSHLK